MDKNKLDTQASIHHVAQVIGNAAWALLQAQYGGRELRVPKTRNSGVWRDLTGCIGVAAADKLLEYYGGDRVAVPMGAHITRVRRLQHIAKLRAEGKTPNQISAIYTEQRRITSRTVKRMLAEVRSVGMQLDLFAA